MIKRTLVLKDIQPFIDKDIVKIITGMRRVGKSEVLRQIQQQLLDSGVSESHFLVINFESFQWQNIREAVDLQKYVSRFIGSSKEKFYLFFDEIQEVTAFEKAINSFRVDYNVDIYLTGSNAALLSSEFATYLAGRYVEFSVYPFSYLEFLEITDSSSSEERLNQYLIEGGMPAIYDLELTGEAANAYISDIYNSIILKDIIKRYEIRDVDLLERIIRYGLENVGNTFSATSVTKFLKSENRKVAIQTVINYLNAAVSTHLFIKIFRDDLLGKKRLTVNEKYYVSDHGLRQIMLGNTDLFHDIERTIENVVALELLRRGFQLSIGKFENKEIDFIAKKGKEVCYYQVTYLLNSEVTMTREFGVLEQVSDNYPKYVISMDKLDFSRNGIRHLSLEHFLTNEQI